MTFGFVPLRDFNNDHFFLFLLFYIPNILTIKYTYTLLVMHGLVFYFYLSIHTFLFLFFVKSVFMHIWPEFLLHLRSSDQQGSPVCGVSNASKQ